MKITISRTMQLYSKLKYIIHGTLQFNTQQRFLKIRKPKSLTLITYKPYFQVDRLLLTTKTYNPDHK